MYEAKWLDSTHLNPGILYAKKQLVCVMEEKSDITTSRSAFSSFSFTFLHLTITKTYRYRSCNVVQT